jgi:hypothetical protein
MAENLGKWPSRRGPTDKIMPSDGSKEDTAPLAVGRWYKFHEFGSRLGNVGLVYFGAGSGFTNRPKTLKMYQNSHHQKL